MQELIKISKHKVGDSFIKTISARELHKKLEIKKPFTHWIKAQITRAGLEENIDYIVIWHDAQKGIVNFLTEKELLEKFSNVQQAVRNGYQSDYILTIESAKHIAMMSGTKKGKDVRNYFIEVEKKFSQALEKQEEKRISPKDIQEMSELGTELIELLKFLVLKEIR